MSATRRRIIYNTEINDSNSRPTLVEFASSPATLTAEQAIGSYLLSVTVAGAATVNLPTATTLVNKLPGAAVGDIIDVQINAGAATANITVAAGTGGALAGVATKGIAGVGVTVRARLTNVSTPAYVAYLL